MKKILTVAIILALIMNIAICENNNTVTVIVTKGSDILCFGNVDVTDIDEDGVLTINDVLSITHSEYYEAGTDGYASYQSDYGLSLGLLWGIDNGGAYSYYINNMSPMDLSAEVVGGDVIHAFIYEDTTAWSDTYCWFNETELTVNAGETVTLTLSSMGYDEAWNVVVSPLQGVMFMLEGVETGIVSGEDGSITFTAPEAGEYLLTAVSDSFILCAPACKLIVK